MLVVRAVFFSLVGAASLAIWIALTVTTTAPDFNRIRDFTKTNCTVVKKSVERSGDEYRGVLEVKLWDHSEKKNLSAIAYQDHEGRYSSSEPTSFLDRYKLMSSDKNIDYDCFWKTSELASAVHSCKLLANDTSSLPMCSLYDSTGTCYRLPDTPATQRTCYSLKSGANAAMRLSIHPSFLVVPFFVIFTVTAFIGLFFSIKLDARTITKPFKFRGITI